MPRRAIRAKKRRREEHRREERVSAALPVKLGKAKGVTRDVSASGVFFETRASYAVGNPIRFALDLDTPWGKARFQCRGKIVRLERRDGTLGVAVRFTDSKPEASERKRRRERVKPAARRQHARRLPAKRRA